MIIERHRIRIRIASLFELVYSMVFSFASFTTIPTNQINDWNPIFLRDAFLCFTKSFNGLFLPEQCITHPPCLGSGEGPINTTLVHLINGLMGI